MPHRRDAGPAPLKDRGHVGLGLSSILIGLFAGYVAHGYGLGTVTEMGAGFFPTVISVLLVLLGAAVILLDGRDLPTEERTRSERLDRTGLLRLGRVFGAVLGGIFLFALTIRPLGLFLSVTLLTAVCSLGHPRPRPVPILLLSLVLAAASALIFVVGLRLHLPTWPDLS